MTSGALHSIDPCFERKPRPTMMNTSLVLRVIVRCASCARGIYQWTGETLSADGSLLEFEPFTPGPPERLPEVYAVLRERFPVYRSASNIWVISRFDDVKAVQSNPAGFSSRPNPYEEDSAPSDAEMTPEK